MKTVHDDRLPLVHDPVAAAAAVYSKPLLSIYDLYVLGFSSRFAWQCPSHLILDFYNEHISARHLDIGVGTGYFLDKCRFPTPDPTIALADLNENSLEFSAQGLQRYRPTRHLVNVLEPFQIEPAGFDSIALNYLLHCLPGNIPSKGIVFENLQSLLNKDGGVIFGTTILGKGVSHNPLAKLLMRAYNAKGIFNNTEDNAEDLAGVLERNFREYSLRVVGSVALFVGRT